MVKLNYQQKLGALSYRFYQGASWTPKAGDFYTTSRADLELYQVVSVEGGVVRTRFTEGSEAIAEWAEDGFLTEGFGPKRVFVPEWVMNASSIAMKPFSTYPEDRTKLLALAATIEGKSTLDEDYVTAADKLADLVKAILTDEQALLDAEMFDQMTEDYSEVVEKSWQRFSSANSVEAVPATNGSSNVLLECLKDARSKLSDQSEIDLAYIDEVISKASAPTPAPTEED